MPQTTLYALGAILVVLVIAGIALVQASRRTQSSPETAAPRGAAVALVYNPSKPQDWPALIEQLTEASRSAGLPEPLIFETTPDDPGGDVAREALRIGVGAVIAAGGDGTVRAVASTLAGTGVPMAIIPTGTGNLFARNIDLPIDDPAAAIAIALGDDHRQIDIGWLRAESTTDETPEHLFLVVAGIGFDGEMVAETNDDLKATIGWVAYGVGAVKGMLSPRMDIRVTIDDDADAVTGKARTVMIANCGWLPAGVALQPDAEVDDGWLDLVTVDTRGGILGWASLGGKLLLRTFGFRGEETELASTLQYHRGRTFRIESHHESWVQVDGDLVAQTSTISARIDPGALLVRVASKPS